MIDFYRMLLLLPQRYVFSSKSQPMFVNMVLISSCCCYHKGTYFQANHNTSGQFFLTKRLLLLPQRYVFSSKSQQKLRKHYRLLCCCCYHKGTYFQANHNRSYASTTDYYVVVATTKVRIFKQITTNKGIKITWNPLLLLPQRYVFSSKSQLMRSQHIAIIVVVATTKVRIFKQITTDNITSISADKLLLLPQRYVFSSKSQLNQRYAYKSPCCCCYHKGTYFQANHNVCKGSVFLETVVVATTKVRIFKQITTMQMQLLLQQVLLLLPQRYVFSSKSQLIKVLKLLGIRCCCYHKGTYFQANHN